MKRNPIKKLQHRRLIRGVNIKFIMTKFCRSRKTATSNVMMLGSLLLSCLVSLPFAFAFVPELSSTTHHISNRFSTHLSLDPALVAAAAGLAGSAAGWASRTNEVNDLEEQTTSTREQFASLQKSINATKEQYEEKKEKYEMDAEFEGQTETIRKDFEKKLEKTKTELKGNYKKKLTEAKDIFQKENELKLVEQEGKARQGYLAEKMNYEQQFNDKSAEDVVKALDRQSQLVSENQSLKDSLSKVQADLEEIMKIKKGLLG